MRFKEQTLILDADDTLWENNALFERVIDDFWDWVNHPTLDRAEIRAILNDIEAANSAAHGYGSKVFLQSLGQCLERLRGRPIMPEERRQIDELAAVLIDHRIELYPEVSETLTELGHRHELFLLTKGQLSEQRRKIDASGLAHHFRGIDIVAEKDLGTYRWLTERHGLTPDTTWMIGNSPKSDIIPARQAGMNAVFIPNDDTWVLEHTVVDPHDERTLTLQRFSDLLDHF